MVKTLVTGSMMAAMMTLATPGAAQPPTPPQAPAGQIEPNDYNKAESWLCRPGRPDDACAIDQTTTVVASDGTTTRETWTGNPEAPIDCFYVYPTVSMDQTPTSDMIAGSEERNVIRQQFARFGSQCRPFAPLYRQVTLRGLFAKMSGGDLALDGGQAYDDVLDAWNHYLTHDNNGRGVALIGHSQGAMILTRLMAEQVDGKPVQSRLVSGMLLGTTLPVPKGKDVGGAFKTVPLCRAPGQTGCVITYASFRSTLPPPATTLFGRVSGEGLEGACTNPAALGGGSGALHAYLTGSGSLIASAVPQKHLWSNSGGLVDTPFVSVPGMLTARCTSNEHASYLEVTVKGDQSDARADDIPGDLGAAGKVQANWGLHLIDVNLAMGNLVEVVGVQAKAFAARKR
ncbi:MAG: DUF3089 domain-containing protein [Acidobacteriota bacterium]